MILLKLQLIKTNVAIMQMRGCRDLPCYVRSTFSGPLADSLMLCTLWISKVVHLPVSANDAAVPTCCFCSFSADAFHFISVAFVIITSAFKRAEYFYTHKQTKKKPCLLPEDFHRQQLGWTDNGNYGDDSRLA